MEGSQPKVTTSGLAGAVQSKLTMSNPLEKPHGAGGICPKRIQLILPYSRCTPSTDPSDGVPGAAMRFGPDTRLYESVLFDAIPAFGVEWTSPAIEKRPELPCGTCQETVVRIWTVCPGFTMPLGSL